MIRSRWPRFIRAAVPAVNFIIHCQGRNKGAKMKLEDHNLTQILPPNHLEVIIEATGGCTNHRNQPAPNPLLTVPN